MNDFKRYTIHIQCGIACKSFTLNALNRDKAYNKAEAIIHPRYVITDIIKS